MNTEKRQYGTFVEVARTRASECPDATAFIFLVDGERQEESISYRELDARARRIAVSLRAAGDAGDRVLLLHPPGLDYVCAFFGCLYAGMVAVPAYPPDVHRLARTLPRLRTIIVDSGARLIASTRWLHEISASLQELAPELASCRWVCSEDAEREEAGRWVDPVSDPSSVAMLQYTSGSTSEPRGAMLTHGNLLHNSEAIRTVFGHVGPDLVGVTWTPPYHDMGLIGGILQPVYASFVSVLMSPLALLQRPMRWLEAISRHRATTSGGANFAYDLCVRKSTPDQRAALDLSSWRVAYNGAEPVRPETLDGFAEAFASAGFRRSAFLPCYGLAEGTLIVSGGPHASSVATFDAEPSALARGHVAAARRGKGRCVVASGEPCSADELVIVDTASCTRAGPNEVGEIWVRGPSVARGYWGQPNATAATFEAKLGGENESFLRTGDLGFLREGQLFVTGRRKDLLIVRGTNYYPHDIEHTAAAAHPALRPGGGAAIAVDVGGEERLVVVHEVDARAPADLAAIISAMRKAIAEAHELPVHAIWLLEKGELPKTSSGKVQRYVCRIGYERQTLTAIHKWESAIAAAPTPVPGAGSLSQQAIASWLRDRIATRLGGNVNSIDGSLSFVEFGLDSLQIVELSEELSEYLGRRLEPTLGWDFPTIDALAEHLAATAQEAGAS